MRCDILGVGFDDLTKDEATERVMELMLERSGKYAVTPNPEIVMCCREREDVMRAVNGAALVVPDGIGIIYGAKILGRPLKERLPGIELTSAVLGKMAERGMSVFLFGARPGIAEKAAENMLSSYPGLRIAGTNDGYFTDDANILRKINESRPDLLMVCLGAPKQELWMADRAGSVDAGLMIGCGGSLDVFAGVVQRAPEAFRKLGLEWFYRLIKEPSRIKRQMLLPKFLFAVIGKRLRGQADEG